MAAHSSSTSVCVSGAQGCGTAVVMSNFPTKWFESIDATHLVAKIEALLCPFGILICKPELRRSSLSGLIHARAVFRDFDMAQRAVQALSSIDMRSETERKQAGYAPPQDNERLSAHFEAVVPQAMRQEVGKPQVGRCRARVPETKDFGNKVRSAESERGAEQEVCPPLSQLASAELGTTGQSEAAVRLDGRDVKRKKFEINGFYTLVPGGFDGHVAYEQRSQTGQPMFLFYVREKKRWKVSDVLGDSRSAFACLRTPDGSMPTSDLQQGATWAVYEGKHNGYVPYPNIRCVPLKVVPVPEKKPLVEPRLNDAAAVGVAGLLSSDAVTANVSGKFETNCTIVPLSEVVTDPLAKDEAILDDPLLQVRTAACDELGRLLHGPYKPLRSCFAATDGLVRDRQPDPSKPGMLLSEGVSGKPRGIRWWCDKGKNKEKQKGAGPGWVAWHPMKRTCAWFSVGTWKSWRMAFVLARLQRSIWESEARSKPDGNTGGGVEMGEEPETHHVAVASNEEEVFEHTRPRSIRSKRPRTDYGEAPRFSAAKPRDILSCAKDPTRCLARTWNQGWGGSCYNRRAQIDSPGFDDNVFCRQHLGSWKSHGRIDGLIPKAKSAEMRRAQEKLISKGLFPPTPMPLGCCVMVPVNGWSLHQILPGLEGYRSGDDDCPHVGDGADSFNVEDNDAKRQRMADETAEWSNN